MFFRLLLLIQISAVGLAESPYLYLFQNAHERMDLQLNAEKAREALEQDRYRRALRLVNLRAISIEEFQQTRTAAALAQLAVKIAELKVTQAALSLKIAQGFSRAGLPIPVCRRRKRKPQVELLSIVKPAKKPKAAPTQESRPGTEITFQKPPEPPEPPPRPDPPNPSPPEAPPLVPPEKPKEVDPPEETPKPKPKPKPGEKPAPKPSGGKT